MFYVMKAPHNNKEKILFSTNEMPEEFEMYCKFIDIDNINVIECSVEPNLRKYKAENSDKDYIMWGSNHGLCYFKESSIYYCRSFKSNNLDEAKIFYKEEENK